MDNAERLRMMAERKVAELEEKTTTLQDEIEDQADMINGLVYVVDELCSLIKKMVADEEPTVEEYDLFQRVVAGADVTPEGCRGEAQPKRPSVLVIGGGSSAMLRFLMQEFPLDDGPLGSVFDD